MTFKDMLEDVLDPTQQFNDISKDLGNIHATLAQNPGLKPILDKTAGDLEAKIKSLQASWTANKQQELEAKKQAEIQAKQKSAADLARSKLSNSAMGTTKKLSADVEGGVLNNQTGGINPGPPKQ